MVSMVIIRGKEVFIWVKGYAAPYAVFVRIRPCRTRIRTVEGPERPSYGTDSSVLRRILYGRIRIRYGDSRVVMGEPARAQCFSRVFHNNEHASTKEIYWNIRRKRTITEKNTF
ncbi:hypothetical protein Clacol_003227 [Clathrus columnatus]|uniref:Uncharacterized protein n=1 Tax=Clathrus columnatus TaxID=1419009 RepID=A0AAV5A8X2_9AGAM|nr:hypothetical protein Clacol_003227 [Clathrus columnatus]